ncbi:MAG TPA: ribose-phosphate pyrophosphokinase-like domain-containing protein, partial [Mycobacteriales bacterium]|nr:ribose-phosphate pyrophosphokinase-like domain-containing protein [Mycobacteriales bacterium]
MLFSGRAHPALADEVAHQLDIAVSPTMIRDFADG